MRVHFILKVFTLVTNERIRCLPANLKSRMPPSLKMFNPLQTKWLAKNFRFNCRQDYREDFRLDYRLGNSRDCRNRTEVELN